MTEIIDAHHHLWRYDPQEYAWISPQMSTLRRDFLPSDLAHEMSRCKLDDGSCVAGSVVVQARQTLEETRWLLDQAETTDWMRGVVGWVPLLSADLPGTLASLQTCRRLKGVRHVVQDEPDDDFLLGDDFNRGIDCLRDSGLVYDILIHERHLPQADAFVRRHPEQVFVLDHLAKPRIREHVLHPWQEHLQRLAENPNVFCKVSGLVTEADWAAWNFDDLEPYLETAMSVFGPDRLMAGSDWPVCLLASGYQRWWSVLAAWVQRLSTADQARILGGNAVRVYGLD